ncbi:MAG: helicase-related protein, partial [Patescibacteria group bacterium]|nr:helicase-related protein [Patescibacteria group bacterium]
VSVGLLTRSRRAIQPRASNRPTASPHSLTKRQLVAKLQNGALDVVVGTHALLQGGVSWRQLALAVVDEQHRFGVQQRKQLVAAAKTYSPHFLSLTATPIPRSLALVLYGDLEISAIRQLPRERKTIVTQMVTPASRPRMYQFVRQQIAAGRQAFVVCPLIDPSDTLGVRSATAEAKILQRDVFADLRIAVLHGKMSAEKKADTMAAFQNRTVDLLVSTTVVEVGVDVPNATVMVVEGAERFGLAQLHQLRGRVGRSTHQSYCFLCTDATAGAAIDRLTAFMQAKNGFELSELDLKFRGPGEILGTEQSGFSQLKLASLADLDLAQHARTAALELLRQDPQLAHHPELSAAVRQREAPEVHLE